MLLVSLISCLCPKSSETDYIFNINSTSATPCIQGYTIKVVWGSTATNTNLLYTLHLIRCEGMIKEFAQLYNTVSVWNRNSPDEDLYLSIQGKEGTTVIREKTQRVGSGVWNQMTYTQIMRISLFIRTSSITFKNVFKCGDIEIVLQNRALRNNENWAMSQRRQIVTIILDNDRRLEYFCDAIGQFLCYVDRQVDICVRRMLPLSHLLRYTETILHSSANSHVLFE